MDGQPGDEAGCLDGRLVVRMYVGLSAWMTRLVVSLPAWSVGSWSSWMVKLVVSLDGKAGREAVRFVCWLARSRMVRLVVGLSAWSFGWWSSCQLGW